MSQEYTFHVHLPKEEAFDREYYDNTKAQLDKPIWICSVSLSHPSQKAEVEFALAPLYTNIRIEIDMNCSGLKASDIIQRACDKLTTILQCELWNSVGEVSQTFG